ncbi:MULTISPECIES: tetratricopeptide repeat protein [unclassified Carboxylicivirga]|uniref:tetratricopeptide repeat protein n=1 Tax=Carboxylicivirga TaxID=1628153 RepID=UPI003D34D5BF
MDYNKKILSFFTGELDAAHREELKLEMADNAKLQEDMKLQQEVLYAIANHQDDYSDFKNQLADLGNEFMEEQEAKSPSFKINYWLAAASLIVVLGLGSYLGLLRDSSYSGGQAFNEYYEAYGTDMMVRGNTSTGVFTKAFEQYRSGDIANALVSFDDLRLENEELAGFFSGLCYIEMGDMEKARQELRSTLDIAIFYEAQIRWYLALCYLKLEEYEEAELLLTQIVADGHTYSVEARSILSKLKV